MLRTGLKCLNVNFISYATQVEGGGALFLNLESNFFCDDLQLQIIASISPKSICRESSAHWAIFFFLILWRQSEYSQGWFLTIRDVAFECSAHSVGHLMSP